MYCFVRLTLPFKTQRQKQTRSNMRQIQYIYLVLSIIAVQMYPTMVIIKCSLSLWVERKGLSDFYLPYLPIFVEATEIQYLFIF